MFKGCKDGIHKFEPRYDVKFNLELISMLKSMKGDLDEIKERIYICDVCIKCGKQTKDNQEN